MTNVTLGAEADAEAARVRRARQLLQNGDRRALDWCDADGPWVLIARRPALRQRLSGRVLLIWRVGCDDGNGRCVEWRIVATSVSLTTDRRRKHDRRVRVGIVRDLEQEARAVVEADCVWRATAVETARAVVLTQLARERAIAAAAAGHASSDERDDADRFQSGLFDRRAERRRLVSAASSEAERREDAERVEFLERAAAIGSPHARLVLVVCP
jgi:hypothetical protein